MSIRPISHHRQYHLGVAVVPVDDPDDPRIADYRNIPDPALLHERRLFAAEGRHVVRRLIAARWLVTRSLMVTAPALAALADDIDLAAVTVFLVPQAVMNTVTGFNIHRGCLAIGERGHPLDWRALARRARRLVVLERIANPDNIGAIFRNAAAFGADAVLLGPDCADPLYRKSIRTSMAAALAVPFATVTPWPDALRELRAEGFFAVGLSPCRSAPTIRDAAGRIGQPVVIVAGHEGDGLTHEATDACDTLARIPISESVDSLNVATAVGIALYELSTTGEQRPADHESRFANHE
jgi:tRNA G18 (ribose-2'-O)-methylase SpoU